MNTDSPRLRLAILGIVSVSLFASLFARLYFLQVMAAPTFQEAAEANRIRIVSEQAPRGRILDRNGKVVVDNRVSIVVALDRAAFNDLPDDEGQDLLGRLADELTRAGDPVTVDDLVERIDDKRFSPYTPVPIAQDMPEELKIFLEEHAADFPGVQVERTSVRAYPFGAVGAHVLGYVGEINDVELGEKAEVVDKPYQQGDDIGKSGVERVYEDALRGVPGVRYIEVDAEGDPIRVIADQSTDPVPGSDVVLTVDIELQAVAEEALAQGLEQARNRRPTGDNPRNQAPAGSVVVEDPRNGEILAMASYPTYNPADFVNGISSATWAQLNDPENRFPLNNWAIQGQYAPGSTFKLVTAYAAATTGLKSPNDVYVDRGTYNIPRCDGGTCIKRNAGSRAYGNVDLRRAITVSSDVYFYDIGAQFWIQQDTYGSEAIQTAARDFGLGAKTGVPLPSEQSGRIPTPDNRKELCEQIECIDSNWYTGDNVNMAIGQGEVALTPLQLVNAYATFANGGTVYSPNIVREIRRPGTDAVERSIEPRVTGEVPLPPAIRDPVLAGLVGVVANREGTADGVFAGFPLQTFPIAGKTGTAQVAGKADTALFTAFGPANAPQFAVTAVLEESGFGGTSAAPVVRRIFDVVSGAVPRPELQPGGVLSVAGELAAPADGETD